MIEFNRGMNISTEESKYFYEYFEQVIIDDLFINEEVDLRKVY